MTCPVCSMVNPEGTRTCMRCGTALTPETPSYGGPSGTPSGPVQAQPSYGGQHDAGAQQYGQPGYSSGQQPAQAGWGSGPQPAAPPQYGQPSYGQPGYESGQQPAQAGWDSGQQPAAPQQQTGWPPGQPNQQFGAPQYGQPGYDSGQQPTQAGWPSGQTQQFGAPPYGQQGYDPYGQQQTQQFQGQPYGTQQYGQAPYGTQQYGQAGYTQPGAPPSWATPPQKKGNRAAMFAIIGAVIVVLVIGGVVLGLTVLSKKTFNADALNRDIASQYHDKFGSPTIQPNCPSGKQVKKGASFTCNGKLSTGQDQKIEVKVTSNDGDYTWKPVG